MEEQYAFQCERGCFHVVRGDNKRRSGLYAQG